MKSQRVLVTGAAGSIGRAVCAELLERGHFVRGFDRIPVPTATEAVVGNLTDAAVVRRSVEGMETVVHLAATPDDADFLSELLPNNIIGLYNVFDAARECGVGKLVVASTGQVTWGILDEKKDTVYVSDGVFPTNHYAVTKVFAEMMARMYATRFGISVIVIRPGWLPREPHHVAALASTVEGRSQYFSPRDAGRAFACAVEVENVPFAVVFATSRSHEKIIYDNEEARRILGFEPLDAYPDGMPFPVPKG